jgi:hypothetical protein
MSQVREETNKSLVLQAVPAPMRYGNQLTLANGEFVMLHERFSALHNLSGESAKDRKW